MSSPVSSTSEKALARLYAADRYRGVGGAWSQSQVDKMRSAVLAAVHDE